MSWKNKVITALSILVTGGVLAAWGSNGFTKSKNRSEDVTTTRAISELDNSPVVMEEVLLQPSVADNTAVPAVSNLNNCIKIALLLDTSSSMDGLIDQAKSQLWKIVNELSLAKKQNEFAEIRIALYEYGNSRLSANGGYVRQIVDFTDDLDDISKELFGLKTNGGAEYCGKVIATSIDELDWQEETEGLQLIFIAGNEPFTQGDMSYATACGNAVENDITVNTIFCGGMEQGVQTKWQHGAELGNGFYGTIEMNEAAVYIATPYDKEIEHLNTKLNATYLAFGAKRDYYLDNQSVQDNNSKTFGSGNATERAVSKSSHLYKNTAWDLVDAEELADFDITKIATEDLPEEMREMTTSEKLAFIALKKKERVAIQEQIQVLNVKRIAFIETEKEAQGISSNGLDKAMIAAIKAQAIAKKFVFEKI